MKNFTQIAALAIIGFISSCASRQMLVGPPSPPTLPTVQVNYYPKVDSVAQKPEVFNPPTLFAGKKKIFFPKSEIQVQPNYVITTPIGIKLKVSNNSNSESEYTDIVSGQTYQNLFDGEKYTITAKDLFDSYNYRLPNNKFLKIEAFNKRDSVVVMTAFFKIQKKYSFINGFSSPVLFRVSGNAAGFNLNSISPSLGINLLQRNFSNNNFDHISLDVLLTITSYPQNLNQSYQYTMATGAVVDFGGYIQVGSSYSYLEKKSYLVLGIKPYLFAKLFGGDK